MRMKLFVAVVGLGVLIAGSSLAQAQQTTAPVDTPATEPTPPGRPPQAFGTGVTIYSIAGLAIPTAHSNATYDVTTDGTYRRYRTGGSDAFFAAPVVIPTGSLLTFLELDGCDTSPGASAFANLIRCPTGEGSASTWPRSTLERRLGAHNSLTSPSTARS